MTWLSKLVRRLRKSPLNNRPMSKWSWPCVEQLEDRWAPAVIQVTTTANAFDAAPTVTIADLAGPGTNPDGLISLREAIAAANNTGGADQIILQSATTYLFAAPDDYWYGPNALPAISSDITIEGNGATLLRDPLLPQDTENAFRFFYISGGLSGLAAGTLTLNNLTMANGLAKGGDAFGGGGGGLGAGGAIFVQGNLNLNGVTLTENVALGGSAFGQNLNTGGGGGGMGEDATGVNGGGFGGAFLGADGGTGGAGDPSSGGASGGGGGFTADGVAGSGNLGGAGGGLSSLGGTGGRDFSAAGGAVGDGGGGAGGRTGAFGLGPGSAGGDFGFGGVGSTTGGGGGGGVGGGGGGGIGGGGGGFGGGGGASRAFVGGGGPSFAGFGGGGGGIPPGSGSFGFIARGGDGGFGGGGAGSVGGFGGGGAGMGGAIFVHLGTVTITNSTLAGNTAQGGDVVASSGGNFGGSGFGGAIFNLNGTVTLLNSTVARNAVFAGGAGLQRGRADGGAVYNLAFGNDIAAPNTPVTSRLNLSNSILANSVGDPARSLNGTTLQDLVNNAPTGSFANGGTNTPGNQALVDGQGLPSIVTARLNWDRTSPSTGAAAEINTSAFLPAGTDPLLDSILRDNGGPTPTLGLLAGSPAIDAGNNSGVPAGVTTDQRGFPRLLDGDGNGTAIVDLGAFEKHNAFVVTGFAAPVTAGTAQIFTVTAVDATGATSTGYLGTVHFTSSDPNAVLSGDYTFTPADAGVRTFAVTFQTAGSQALTVNDVAAPSFSGRRSGITVNPAAASSFVLNVPSTFTAGVAQSFTVTAVDPFGNLATDYTGTVRFTSTDPKAGLPGNYKFTAADAGVHTFTATFKTAGPQSLTAKDTQSATFTGSQSFTVAAAAAKTVTVSGFPTPTVAGQAHDFTVSLKDAFGNIATGYTGTVRFTSSDSQAELPADYTFTATDDGMHTFSANLKTAGGQFLRATDTANSMLADSQTGISVTPAAMSTFAFTGLTTVTAGVAGQLTVTIVDPFGNKVGSYRGTVHFTSSDSQATLPADYKFNGDKHTFNITLRTAGTQSVTLTDTVATSITATRSDITVNPAAAKVLVVSGFPSPTTAGVAQTLMVTALDAYGNIATGYTGTVRLTSSDANAVLPPNYKFTAGDAGVHTFTATLNTIGTQSLTATDINKSNIMGTQFDIVVTL